ncbi:hypothetical protein HAX54_007827 [Datura stramonium]|uniref:Uncharacterized protein n=1 Tax=Datura stramonium TaxID=4076 RepID=A0ABS8RWN5_DATST|nr:hypothetical protein [Datura stramonium]
MLEARDSIGHAVLWEPRIGNANILHENWTRLDPLAKLLLSTSPMDTSIGKTSQDIVGDNGMQTYLMRFTTGFGGPYPQQSSCERHRRDITREFRETFSTIKVPA